MKQVIPGGACRGGYLEGEKKFGAGNETRTRDPDLGKVVLYQLSYSRLIFVFHAAALLQPESLRLVVLLHSEQIWSGKRDSNSRPRPWQGRALPTELFPQNLCCRNDEFSVVTGGALYEKSFLLQPPKKRFFINLIQVLQYSSHCAFLNRYSGLAPATAAPPGFSLTV